MTMLEPVVPEHKAEQAVLAQKVVGGAGGAGGSESTSYEFNSRFEADKSSVSNSGQMARTHLSQACGAIPVAERLTMASHRR